MRRTRDREGRARAGVETTLVPVAAAARGQALSVLDAGFLYLDRPAAPLQIGAVLRVDGTDLHDATVDLLGARVGELPRFTEVPRPVPLSAGHPAWQVAADFDPANHVFSWAVPASAGDPASCRPLRRLLAEPLPAGRPLWDLHLFESRSAQSTAVLFRAHHCMLDGLAGLACLDRLLDGAPEAGARAGLPLPPAEGRRSGPWTLLGHALQHQARRQRGSVALAASWLRHPSRVRGVATRAWSTALGTREWLRERVPEQRWNQRVTRDRQLATATLSLDRIREIRRSRGCSFNDVVLCVIGGGLARYLARRGEAAPAPLQALVPVGRSGGGRQPGASANHIAAMRVSVPVDGVDEVSRLARIQQTTRPLMTRRAWETSEGWLELLELLPPAIVAPLARAARVGRVANLIVTSVPGPGEKRKFCGRPVHEILPVVPIYHHLGLGVAAMSYAGQLALTLHADAQQVPDLDRLAADVSDASVALHRSTTGPGSEEAR